VGFFSPLFFFFFYSRQWGGMLLKPWGMLFSTGYNAHLSKSKRMLLGLLQNLRMLHPGQKSLNHVESYGECRTIITALPRLSLSQVCQISSNKLFPGVALPSLLLRLFFCAVEVTVVGGKKVLPSLETFGPVSCCVVSALEFFLCRLF